jgi:uncharacterized membrane protein
VSKEIWHKRLLYARDRLCFYPAPEPLPRTRKFWIVMGLISVAVISFCAFYIYYLCAKQTAFQTNAEDFGIMDQAVWNTIHGNVLHQTICDSINDTNCGPVLGAGYTRFAIHFEPILFPISLLYFIWSDPRILIVLQTVVVAIGAYPAFWLARLRLRNEWLAGIFALLYLIYPAQLQATTYDFHAVTLTAALLLFTLYFMYTRQTLWFFVFAILAMACKEDIPLVIATFAFWSIIFQRRWKSGLALTLFAVVWFIVATKVIMPHFSPTGQAMLSARYSATGGVGTIAKNVLFHPVTFLRTYVFEPAHLAYIHSLLAPAGYIPKPHGGGIFYLPLLAPWILIMAVPSIAVNLLSSNPQQYTGLFQYNAEIVPVIIFSTIEALVVVRWFVRICIASLARRRVANVESAGLVTGLSSVASIQTGRWQRVAPTALTSLLLVAVMLSALRTDYYFHGQLPFSIGFQWPQSSAHTALAQRFIDMIPPDASVSAQTKLVPHLSQRKSIYMFPYDDTHAEYIFLDVTGDIYPYLDSQPYDSEVKKVLASGSYGVVAAQDGYLLLKYGLPAPHILSTPDTTVPKGQTIDPAALLFDLPASFCSNIYVSQQEVTHPLQVDFKQPDGSKLHLVGFDVGASSPFSRTNGYGTLTTYWRVDSLIKTPLQLLTFMQGSDGHEYITSTDMPNLSWCPAQTWQPGTIVRLTSRTFNLQQSGIPDGLAQMSIALLPQAQSSSTITDVHSRLPLQILDAASTVTASKTTNALQLMPLTIVN